MKNYSKVKNDHSIKQILSDQNLEHTDFYANFISPWYQPERISQQIESPHFHHLSKHHQNLTSIPFSNKIKPPQERNQRARTQESKHPTSTPQFRKKYSKNEGNFSYLLADDYFTKRQLTTPLKIKRNRQVQSRRKFKTPVVNINQISFTKDNRVQISTLIPKLQQKFNSNINIHRTFIFPKQNSSLILTKSKKTQPGKIQASKTIPMKRMSEIQRSKKMRQQLQNFYVGHGALVENLKRILQPQAKKGFRQTKCKSVNKFNKTIF